MMISDAIAQTAGAAAAQPNALASLFPFLLIIVIFYFLMIRPQSKKYKAHQAMIADLKRGDEVVTNGGIIGKITKLESDEIIQIEVAKETVVRLARSSVSNLNTKEDQKEKASSSDNASKSKNKKKSGELVNKKVANDN